ncbi:GNAT family N-acetyltransferase [Pelagibius sp. Alg239-R121]|uniref:GNAT family N-acetyltransferase n=1 Tax=Pelagibius sp. Alg239-R121 TaxID=2993448 RepID=UPI0024A799AF|nr:GNAT family N-acetyltransferase [Pelagibius sp. Alg239-R121]
MSDEIVIRPFCDADAPDVQALFVEINRSLATPGLEESFEGYIERSLKEEISRIPEYYAERDGSFWVADCNDEIVGMFGLESHGDSGVELRRMYVKPSWQRRGIARRLIQHAEKHSRESGVGQLLLSTSELQEAALSLYRNAGYRTVREEVAENASNKTIGGGIRRYHFVKDL